MTKRQEYADSENRTHITDRERYDLINAWYDDQTDEDKEHIDAFVNNIISAVKYKNHRVNMSVDGARSVAYAFGRFLQ